MNICFITLDTITLQRPFTLWYFGIFNPEKYLKIPNQHGHPTLKTTRRVLLLLKLLYRICGKKGDGANWSGEERRREQGGC